MTTAMWSQTGGPFDWSMLSNFRGRRPVPCLTTQSPHFLGQGVRAAAGTFDRVDRRLREEAGASAASSVRVASSEVPRELANLLVMDHGARRWPRPSGTHAIRCYVSSRCSGVSRSHLRGIGGSVPLATGAACEGARSAVRITVKRDGRSL